MERREGESRRLALDEMRRRRKSSKAACRRHLTSKRKLYLSFGIPETSTRVSPVELPRPHQGGLGDRMTMDRNGEHAPIVVTNSEAIVAKKGAAKAGHLAG